MTSASQPVLRIGMVAGEVSGDILGSGLIAALRQHFPQAQFEGIGGPLMLAEGFQSQVPMERLSVMGLVEVLGRIRELFGIRRQLVSGFLQNPPDLFIGIDAPDFNLGLEEQLRSKGIRTAHYVSPSVWAWRQKRIFKIARAVDLMLTLLPFEAKFYEDHQVPVRFVGHPLADLIPIHSDRAAARSQLELPQQGQILAILPGSRGGEVGYLCPTFLQTAQWLARRVPGLLFVVPAVNAERRQQIEAIRQQIAPELNLRIVDGQSREVMIAADAVLLASGTATLEAMLVKRPMVVAYKMAPVSFRIMRRLMKAPYIALPNLLAGRALVPEFIQEQATSANLGKALLRFLRYEVDVSKLEATFAQLHQQIRRNASEQAALAVMALLPNAAAPKAPAKPSLSTGDLLS